jgi:protease YdgD
MPARIRRLCALALLPGLGAGIRQPVDVTHAPWSSLVRVQVAGSARCTGVVIAPRQILTAAHCVYITRAGHFAPPAAIHVLAGYDAGDFRFHATSVALRTLPGWTAKHPDFTADAALITLAENIPAPPLAFAEPRPGPAMLGGYNQDRAQVLLADTDCRILATGRMIRHSCAATRGTSGAPLLVPTPSGWAIGGLQVGAESGQGGIAVPVATLQGLL